MGRSAEAGQAQQDALGAFDPPQSLSSWELYWYIRTARSLGREGLAQAAEAVLARRDEPAPERFEGQRPVLRSHLGSAP